MSRVTLFEHMYSPPAHLSVGKEYNKYLTLRNKDEAIPFIKQQNTTISVLELSGWKGLVSN